MKVEVLGTGCKKCHSLRDMAKQAIDRLGADCELVEVTQIAEIASRGVLITPALVVDGVVKCSGKLPSVDQILGFLQQD